MLPLSPHHLPSFGWQIEDDMIYELHYEDLLPNYNPGETDTSCQSLSLSSPPPSIRINDQHHSNTTKKSNHNAYERDRRKKLNHLYSSLRSLLPETHQNKRQSIPCTVAHVVKYIPELQRRLERLIQRKEEILSRASKGVEADHLVDFSSILEGKGLLLLNASTFTTDGGKTFYNLHLQEKRTISMESQSFSEHLMNVLKEQGTIGSICNARDFSSSLVYFARKDSL